MHIYQYALIFYSDDHSRVVLDTQNGDKYDYINANFIEVSRKYMLTEIEVYNLKI